MTVNLYSQTRIMSPDYMATLWLSTCIVRHESCPQITWPLDDSTCIVRHESCPQITWPLDDSTCIARHESCPQITWPLDDCQPVQSDTNHVPRLHGHLMTVNLYSQTRIMSPDYMATLCGQQLSLAARRTKALSLELTSAQQYDPHMNCYISVIGEAGSQIMTSFEWVDINSFRHCPGDFLQIVSGYQGMENQSASEGNGKQPSVYVQEWKWNWS